MLKKNNNLKLNKKINKNTKNRKILLKKIFLSLILILFLIIIVFFTISNTYLNKINKIDIDKTDLNLSNAVSNQENTQVSDSENIINKSNTDINNIALFGIDEPEGNAGRSDCIMLLTIDDKHDCLKLSSIIRDSYVTIPTQNKKDKINHAYAFGGPKLALQTINENFKLNIDKFISVNFSSLPKIIDDIGGIQLDISDEELKYINNYINELNKLNATSSPNILASGNQIVDGTQALAYCRIRYTSGGDFERSQRHRTVLSKLLEKANNISITKYPTLLNEILPIIHTNLEKTEIISLALDLTSLKNGTILQDRFPCDEDGDGKNIDGVYYFVFNEEITSRRIHNFIYGE